VSLFTFKKEIHKKYKKYIIYILDKRKVNDQNIKIIYQKKKKKKIKKKKNNKIKKKKKKINRIILTKQVKLYLFSIYLYIDRHGFSPPGERTNNRFD